MLGDQPEDPERRQRQGHGAGLVAPGDGLGVDVAIGHAATAEVRGVGVERLRPAAAGGHADAVAVTHDRGQVGDAGEHA